jgi:2-amino-4-hydroxy-6-hydroxymethyldihydropteridine diphosphokinase
MPTPVIAYIALGSNLGDREQNIRAAITALDRSPDTHITKVSSLVENPAVGGPANSPDFLNGAAEIETTLSPHELLHRLLEIEKSLGRHRREKWEPRIIDLDVILYGDQCISSSDLTVPHPLMHARRFVLGPLAELAPNLKHPAIGLTIATLFANLPKDPPV